MIAHGITPILNVSDIHASFAWFEKLGWTKGWDWGELKTFGMVRSGKCEIFLCENGQGGRGKGDNTSTFGADNGETSDHGVWMSIFVDEVDSLYQHCLSQGIEVVWPPTNMEWGTREMHVRHPDGHIFRFGHGIEDCE
jgi:predicted lactoylglutathione lyase